ncbi:aldehyde dehydrogenase family protein [Mycobacterium stomatepiae]|uniref:Betaine-aldehyde dehydrogenase n=1 Tax=Mycobacterium stomatepiae TaxID=470076 RepID=A0A7I7Q825_9MYCO|nr:aldehyde dehydrogenase family protein [Mycobacterium stomatepiae]MCV7163044.1 aldehyde dehydrogenase family protein [Mycobacterium stomatepiae]BBY22196.1 betaine-aldehyde dehydrogenase [Mycobacterium stomatepiae]
MAEHLNLYIAGEWRPAGDGARREIRCPADSQLVATAAEASAADTRAAIAAARKAFDEGSWPRTPERERADLLGRTAALIARNRGDFARAEALDTGKRLVEAECDMDDVVACLRHYAAVGGSHAGQVVDTGRPDVVSRLVYEPIGVCGLITPWNYPLLQAIWKVAPALLAGNTVVLKPSELTPSTAVLLMQALQEAGLPAGVANLVLGPGPTAGAPLAEHPDVDMVSFTGGMTSGTRVMTAAAQTVKRVALELGGKNPNVVFADADFETAVDYALTAVFLHSGQVCSAGARLLVEQNLHDRFVDEVVARARRITLGGPFDPDAETGPLISAAHRDKVEAYMAAGLAEGAVLRCGGRRPDDPRLRDGFFYPPTVLDECSSGMSVTQEESFGPVLTVETFTDEDEAVALANDTVYGLAGAVWTQDAGKAQRVANRLRHGTIWINDYHPYVPQAEWGGMKRSGNGRELGRAGLDEYREIKHIWQNINPQPTRWFRGSPT